jgi:hypothetical protein
MMCSPAIALAKAGDAWVSPFLQAGDIDSGGRFDKLRTGCWRAFDALISKNVTLQDGR